MRGFSLIELSISLLIITLILSGGVLAFSGQREMDHARQMQKDFAQIKEALYGFAITYGRLPCPANAAGQEDCSTSYGFLPAQTLGVLANDVWGNRIRYFVHSAFSASVEQDRQSAFSLNTGGSKDDAVRKTLPDIYDTTNGQKLVVGAAAVFWSEGKGGKHYRSMDERSNNEHNLVFIYRAPTEDFDDMVDWISPFVLKAKMLAAQRLP